MELENLVKLIQTVSDSDLTGFQYEENGVKLKIQKEKEQMVVSTGAAQLTTVQNVPGAQSNAVSALKSEDGPEKGKEAEGQLIKSPLVGTFYAAPSEEAAPFVAVGDHVSKGQTVAIVDPRKRASSAPAGSLPPAGGRSAGHRTPYTAVHGRQSPAVSLFGQTPAPPPGRRGPRKRAGAWAP